MRAGVVLVPCLGLLAVALGCGGSDEGTPGGDAGGGGMDAVVAETGTSAPPDGSTPAPDGDTPAPDAGPPAPDGGPGPRGGTGTPCMRNGDCPEGVCLPITPGEPTDPGRAVCTTHCATGADCVAGWTCGAIGGVSGNVCQCTQDGGRGCNGRDDDCDGRPDSPAGSDGECGEGASCVAGTCVCDATCGGTECVDLSNDPTNCGACGNVCPLRATCFRGECVCSTPTGGGASGLTLCDGACVDTRTDDGNCGGCGIVCADDEERHCDGGTCVCDGRNLTFCGGSCVDTRTDASNCGACGTVCAAGCTDGRCDCLPPQVRCGDACVDASSDEANCGGCGIGCPEGWTCCGGGCRDTPHDVTSCGTCDRDCRREVESGGGLLLYCDAGTCGSCDRADPACTCPAGLTDCSSTCIDTSHDFRNCGRCGNYCGSCVGCRFTYCGDGRCG